MLMETDLLCHFTMPFVYPNFYTSPFPCMAISDIMCP
uniref:Uncharacterized protein n=1 Tax=Anguilla anguilla TaxID=7936 RepID=A0A0E9TBE2_ANGAN